MTIVTTDNIPIVYKYIFYKIKKDNKTQSVDYGKMKEIASRLLVKRGGFPKYMVKYVIRDFVYLGLVTKINSAIYKLEDHNFEKEIKCLLSF
jgi:hypothetical protein